MSRSRSSFDLTGAIATATSLTTTEEPASSHYRGMTLVSFGPTASGPPTVAPPPSERPPTPSPAPSVDDPAVSSDPGRRLRRLPDLSDVPNPVERCELILEWIVEATGASDVFLADAAGLPIAGAGADAEARLAAAGNVTAAITQLAASLPGAASSVFELHVGDGPFFQVIGFQASGALYLVGLTRHTPLGHLEARAIRLACRHALSEGGA